MVNHIADSTEEHIIGIARDDAADALSIAERPEVCSEELRLLVRKLTAALRDVATVADLRGERLSEPGYGPVARALEEALRASFRR